MIKRAFLITLLVLIAACSEKQDGPKPLSEPGEKLYTVRGVILSRNADDNTIRTDHEAIPGFMEAMIMDYSVRGMKVDALGADKTRFEAKLHVTERTYWLTDVKQIP